MARFPWRRTLALFCVFGAAWLGIRWLFPLFFPFFLGGTLALLAEPAVKFFSRKMPRAGASVLAVGILLLLLAGLLVLLCSAILRNLGLLAKALPDMERTASNALSLLRSRLTLLAEKLPTPVRKIGVNDEYGHSGPAAALLKQFGLSAEHIAQVAKEFVK